MDQVEKKDNQRETLDDLKKIKQELDTLNVIQQQFNKLVETDGNNLIQIEKNVEVCDNQCEIGAEELSHARKWSNSWRSTLVYLTVSGLMLLNFPIGLTLGVKVLAVSLPITGLCSGTALLANHLNR